MMQRRFLAPGVALLALLVSFAPASAQIEGDPQEGSVIFIHPDGAAVNSFSAARLLAVGPDGDLHWDLLPHIGIYRGHQYDVAGTSSNAGATAHAFGVKVPLSSYGTFGDDPLTALSGASMSVMTEAKAAGFATAIVNSGHIAEPGTGVFVASNPSRDATDDITSQILASGTDIILSGGEIYLLPEGVSGRHGEPGIRQDGRNLIDEATRAGYTVVYDRDQLLALDRSTDRVLGVFAADHTFHDSTEEVLEAAGLPMYEPEAPTVGEMTRVALEMLEAKGERFILVVEEEGSDNFANDNHAMGTITALRRADDAIGVARDYLTRAPETLLITGADSDAGGMQVVPIEEPIEELPYWGENGSPLDGIEGSGSAPFISAPDASGRTLPFAIGWASSDDLLGGVASRAQGLNSELLPPSVDNTDIYRMMYGTLFGEWPEAAATRRR